MEIDKDGESFFLLLIMLITSIINDHVYLIVTFRLMQFDFNVGQFRVRPFTKLSDIYFQNKKLRALIRGVESGRQRQSCAGEKKRDISASCMSASQPECMLV